MMLPTSEDDTSSLERARERLYTPHAHIPEQASPVYAAEQSDVPHSWKDVIPMYIQKGHPRHVRIATVFFGVAALFFFVALGVTGYFLSVGGNTVSVDKVAIDIQGPTTISGGDIVPFSVSVTNRNPVALENAIIEIDFPEGTRSANNVLQAYQHYTENLGTLPSGATVTRSVKAIVFGNAGQALVLPVLFSYGTKNSNAVFVKKSTYALAVTSAPLSVSVDTLAETVSGEPFTITLTVRSNANVPLSNVVLSGAYPFGFSTLSSSAPSSGNAFLLGTLAPGDSKIVTIKGVLNGLQNEKRTFHFTVGTARSGSDQSLAVTYMKQEATVALVAPFISTTLSINGSTADPIVVTPGSTQSVVVSYINTLPTAVTNASVSIGISGSAVDYESIQSGNGFYNSSTRTVVFSRDTDASLATLAPGASGIGAFTFSTLPAGKPVTAPSVVLTVSVSGTRVGQSSVPEIVTSSATKTIKVATAMALTAVSLRTSGPFTNSGPVPPRIDLPTTYTIQWSTRNLGNAVAGGVVTATLPSYVSYTGKTSGVGAFGYDEGSRRVTWNVGDSIQGGTAQGAFQVALTPSSSQRGSAPVLVGEVLFTGFDRFAGTQISATAEAVTTETTTEPGYTAVSSTVQ